MKRSLKGTRLDPVKGALRVTLEAPFERFVRGSFQGWGVPIRAFKAFFSLSHGWKQSRVALAILSQHSFRKDKCVLPRTGCFGTSQHSCFFRLKDSLRHCFRRKEGCCRLLAEQLLFVGLVLAMSVQHLRSSAS